MERKKQAPKAEEPTTSTAIRLTATEHAKLRAISDAKGITASLFLRQVIAATFSELEAA